jgi:uncharacterized membrane protein YvbJ
LSTQNKFCVSCGSELPGTSRFCNSCGTPVPRLSEHNRQSERQDDEYGEWFNATCVNCSNDVVAIKKFHLPLFILMLILVFPVAIIYLALYVVKNPKDCPVCGLYVDNPVS